MNDGRKKPRIAATSAAPPLDALTSLPSAVVRSIFSFVLYESELNSVCTIGGITHRVQGLATVSKAWFGLLDELASEQALQVVLLRGRNPMNRQSMLDMRRRIILRRGFLREIMIHTAPVFDYDALGFWSAALSHAPQLRTMDLSPRENRAAPLEDLASTVEAAGRHCPLIKQLTFPSQLLPRPVDEHEDTFDLTRNYTRDFIRTLLKAMVKWSNHGGIQRLWLAMDDYLTGYEATTLFVERIVAFCPQIERLDGYFASTKHHHYLSCKEHWVLDLETWERFCRTCTQLMSLNWIKLPFATEFFEIFGKYPKPHLESLSITTSRNWSWKKFLREVDEPTRERVKVTGYGRTARNAYKIVEACPNLRSLTVDWYDHIDRTGITKSMEYEVFGDDFCESVARHCRRLASLSITPVRGSSWDDDQSSILTLTDRSMTALATLPQLTLVSISGANITGEGLFDLVVNHATDEINRSRKYEIAVGDCSRNGNNDAFYSVLGEFVKRLAAFEGELPCARRPVTLKLVNSGSFRPEPELSVDYLESVMKSVKTLKSNHPTVKVRGIVTKNNDQRRSFCTFQEFHFATGGVEVRDHLFANSWIRVSPITEDFVSYAKVNPYGDDPMSSDDDDSPSEGEEDDERGHDGEAIDLDLTDFDSSEEEDGSESGSDADDG